MIPTKETLKNVLTTKANSNTSIRITNSSIFFSEDFVSAKENKLRLGLSEIKTAINAMNKGIFMF